MTDVKNNPAGRLHDILREATQSKGNETARNVWSSVFQIEKNNTSEILKMLADLIDLIHDTKSNLDRLPNIDHELYKKPFTKIERAFSQIHLDGHWEPCRSQLDEATLLGLQFSSDQLSRVSSYTSINESDLEGILAELDKLTLAISDSTLPDDLKMLLVKNLEAVRRSILAYKIKGLEGIEQEIERGIGSLLLHKEEIHNSESSDKDGGIWRSYFSILERLNKIVALARDSKELVAPVLKLLGFNGV